MTRRAYRSVVTGAGRGIGRSIAIGLAKRGSSVVVTDVDEEAADDTARAINDAGGRAIAKRCDVRNVDDMKAIATAAEDAFGTTELLVNNAGVMAAGQVDEIPLDEWRFCIDVNLWGTIHGCHVFVPAMKKRGFGKILNVGSIAGVICTPETAPYNVTKAGILALSETLSSELGMWGIDVTALCPTAVNTGFFDAMRTPNALHARMAKKALFGAVRHPDEVALAALDAVDAGRLYVFPQLDGKALWGIKRIMPRVFHGALRFARTHRLFERIAK
jgi:short-subunit dehydrogenase